MEEEEEERSGVVVRKRKGGANAQRRVVCVGLLGRRTSRRAESSIRKQTGSDAKRQDAAAAHAASV